MRRKVLQDFANTFCQYYVDYGGLCDTADFACYGSGTALIDFLSGNCTFDGKPVPALKSSTFLTDWLARRFAAHHIAVQDIVLAQMTVKAVVSDLKFNISKVSYGYSYGAAHFEFDCQSEIKTDEKSYSGQMSGIKSWGFNKKYYDALCGQSEAGN